LRNCGGNPDDNVPPKGLEGKVDVPAVGVAGSMPAARNFSSRELGSATDVDVEVVAGSGL
jgi:hypothetical protein